MYYKKQFNTYKKHLQDRYAILLEKADDYRIKDEAKSDLAAFKAIKLLEKINQVRYLDREVSF